MKIYNRRGLWAAVLVAAAAAVFLVQRKESRRAQERFSVEADLHDALNSPLPAPAASRMALGRPAPASYFAGPEARHAELDEALLSSRRARARARARSRQ